MCFRVSSDLAFDTGSSEMYHTLITVLVPLLHTGITNHRFHILVPTLVRSQLTSLQHCPIYLNINDFRSNKPTCDCCSLNYIPASHVITGDIDIESNLKLYKLIFWQNTKIIPGAPKEWAFSVPHVAPIADFFFQIGWFEMYMIILQTLDFWTRL